MSKSPSPSPSKPQNPTSPSTSTEIPSTTNMFAHAALAVATSDSNSSSPAFDSPANVNHTALGTGTSPSSSSSSSSPSSSAFSSGLSPPTSPMSKGSMVSGQRNVALASFYGIALGSPNPTAATAGIAAVSPLNKSKEKEKIKDKSNQKDNEDDDGDNENDADVSEENIDDIDDYEQVENNNKPPQSVMSSPKPNIAPRPVSNASPSHSPSTATVTSPSPSPLLVKSSSSSSPSPSPPVSSSPSPPHSLSPTSSSSSSSSPVNAEMSSVMSRFCEFHTDLTLESSRRLIKEGPLGRQAKFKVVERIVYLFSDCFLITDLVTKGENTGKLIQKQLLNLSTVVAQDFSMVTNANNKKKTLTPKDMCSFSVLTPDRDFQFIAATPQVKSEWITAISQAASAYKLHLESSSPEVTAIDTKKDPRLLSATLHSAVREGADDILLHLLSEREDDVNAKDANGDTPLHIAVKNGNHGAISILLSFGSKINEEDGEGETPLHTAAKNSDYGSAMILASKGANCNTKNKHGKTPFWLFCVGEVVDIRAENEKKMKEMRRKSSHDPHSEDPHKSTEDGNKNDEEDDNDNDNDDDSNVDDVSSVIDARGLVDLIHLMIDNGHADPDETDDDGKTLIQHLALQGKFHAISALVERKATLTTMDSKGHSAIHYAVHGATERNFQTVSADFNPQMATIKPPKGKDHHISSYVSTIKLLLSYGANPNQRDNDLNTPLAFSRSPAIACALILGGGRIDLKNSKGVKCTEYFECIRDPAEREFCLSQIKEAKTLWDGKGVTHGDGQLMMEEKNWIADNDSEHCILCGQGFSLLQRRHHCRRSGTLICQSCGTKQFVVMKSQKQKETFRCCDCCYNVMEAKDKEAKKKDKERKREMAKVESQLEKEKEKLRAEYKKSHKEKEEETLKEVERLREEHRAKTKNSSPNPTQNQNDKVNSTKTTLNENKNLLVQRGQKLNELAEKAERMESDAKNFSDLATKLKNKQKKDAESWF